MFRPGTPLPGADTEGDQPRPMEDGARHPTAAERVRTLVESSVSADLSIPGAEPTRHPAPSPLEQLAQFDESAQLGHNGQQIRAVTREGDVVLLVPASSQSAQLALRAQDDEVTAVLELTDVAPVAVPHRVRGRTWVGGWLTAVRADERAEYARLLAGRGSQEGECTDEFTPERASEPAPAEPAGDEPAGIATTAGGPAVLLRLEVGEAYVEDVWGCAQVEPEDFAAARPDPLAVHEAELLQHLAEAHQEQLRGLCVLLDRDGPCCRAGTRVVPLSLDSYGLRVRLWDAEGLPAPSGGERGCVDARFEFPEPVGDVVQLRRAMRRLFAAAEDESSH